MPCCSLVFPAQYSTQRCAQVTTPDDQCDAVCSPKLILPYYHIQIGGVTPDICQLEWIAQKIFWKKFVHGSRLEIAVEVDTSVPGSGTKQKNWRGDEISTTTENTYGTCNSASQGRRCQFPHARSALSRWVLTLGSCTSHVVIVDRTHKSRGQGQHHGRRGPYRSCSTAVNNR